jgi:Mg2+ and Co2+ transporter CorA
MVCDEGVVKHRQSTHNTIALPRAFSVYSRPTFDRSTSQTSVPVDRTRKGTFGFGHRRKHSPNIEWKETWTKETWKQGRVLLIDYCGKEHSGEGRKKIVAQEFRDIDSLRRFYRKEDLSGQAALRVIHVQNATWATRFLLRKFNIDASDDLVGTTFGRWARYERPQQRGGKPVLNGKTFRTQRDPWRGISRASFGCDYLKHYPKRSINPLGINPMMELNHYDEADQPCYGFDVYVQRLSVYVQLSDGRPGQAVDPDIPNPYNEEAYEEYQRLKKSYGNVDANEHQERYIPKLRTLDNSNTVIIFENSQSGSVKDTLIGARQELESRWRRLTFYLPREDMENDETLATECMDFILKDIFKALAYNWNRFLAACETHVGILEDKIYENPADESRAPELWKNSAQWLKVERLLYIHADLVKDMRSHLHELATGDPKDEEPWLGSVPDELEKLTGQWDRDIIGPTSSLSDLMYKSVGIRDARHSLQLGLSMWRLSWITFIFLPLTFTVGFFGMNVGTFANNPPIKWWFVVSVPILALVLILWYGVKHSLSTQRQNPLRRGVYEALYHELATQHSELWSRKGPRKGVVPVGWWNGIKWRLVTTWFSPDKLSPARNYDPATQEFGAWSRFKQYLVRRWLVDLPVLTASSLPTASPSGYVGDVEDMDKDLGAVGELLSIATPVAIAELDPTGASRLQKRVPIERLRSLSPTRSDGGSDDRSASSGGRSGVMVEEKGASEDERSGDEGKRKEDRAREEKDRRKRLDVPLR